MSGGKLRGFNLRGLEFAQKAADIKKASPLKSKIGQLTPLCAEISREAFNGFIEVRQLLKDLNDLPGLEVSE